MSENLDKLLLIIRYLSIDSIPQEFNGSIDLATQTVQELTQSVWSEEHGQLLIYLDELSQNTYQDIQLFWLECLKFPYKFPLKKIKDGPLIDEFDGLPSDFNKVSFHDSIIRKIDKGSNICLEIDLAETWRDDKYEWVQEGRRTQVIFQNATLIRIETGGSSVGEYFDSQSELTDFQPSNIQAFCEVPITRYAFDKFKLGVEYPDFVNTRLFILELLEGYSRITLTANNWSLEAIGDTTGIG